MGNYHYEINHDISFLILKAKDDSIPSEIYTGFWNSVRDVRTYKGILLYSNGGLYEGSFKDNSIEGEGRKISSDGEYYIGNFLSGKKHGKGKAVLANKTIYEGSWRSDYMDGEGICSNNIEGWRYEGYYVKGKENGKGKLLEKSGDIKEGVFIDGKIINGVQIL